MQYIKSALILISFLLLAKGAVALFNVQFPAPIIAMIALFVALEKGLIAFHHVEPSAKWLLAYFPVFFIPAGVGLSQHFGFISDNIIAIVVAVFCATLITLLCVGKLASWLFGEKHAH
jgi:holin-like protein